MTAADRLLAFVLQLTRTSVLGCISTNYVQDNSWNLAFLKWSCQTFLEIKATLDPHDDPNDTARTFLCEGVVKRLAPFPRDATGALMVARFQNGTVIRWDQANQMGVELGMPIWPLGVVSVENDRRTVEATADEYMLQDCKNTFSCDDLVWTIRAGVNAAARRGDATHGNITAFLNTDRKRLNRENEPFLPGCSVPCGHCQPCVGPNTMVEEGANPILEGGIVIASNVLDMLLQDQLIATTEGSSSNRSTTVISIFPAVPAAWDEARFFHLRCLSGFVVSAVRKGGATAWAEVISEGGRSPLVIEADFGRAAAAGGAAATAGGAAGGGYEPTLSAPPGVKLVTAGQQRWELVGLKAGESAILCGSAADCSSSASADDLFVVEPLVGNVSEYNYYGWGETAQRATFGAAVAAAGGTD